MAAIFNKSIATRTFPAILKHAFVCPIPKSSSPRLSDFRPISLTSSLSKIFERIVLEHIKPALIPIYGTEQHAYRPQGSTTTALTELSEHVTEALDSREYSFVHIFCLDLSRAFDKLQHNRLINFLNDRGLNGAFLIWLQSFLTSRVMQVRVLNNYGPLTAVPSGVPQGTVLAPFLFAAFMGGIHFNFSDTHRCVKYADDVTIIEPVRRDGMATTSLDACETIFRHHGLTLNRNKCKELRVCLSSPVVLPASVSGFSVTDKIKVLGVIISNDFKWNAQMSHLMKVASRRLYIIRCLKKILNKDNLVNVYHALITPLFTYASPAYGCLPSSLLEKLERFQNRAHRLICGPRCGCSLFPSIRSRFERAALATLHNAEASPSHPLHRLVPDRLQASRKLRQPSVISDRRLKAFIPWVTKLDNEHT